METIKVTPRLRRVLEFVPASALRDDTHSLTHYARQVMASSIAVEYRPDCLIFDLEDSVSTTHKVAAAQALEEFLDSCERPGGVEIILRVNHGGSPRLAEWEHRLAARSIVDAVMTPKVGPADYEEVLAEWSPLGKPILPIIETAAAFNERDRILGAMSATERLHGLEPAGVLGLDDLAADLRIARELFFEDAAYRSMLGLFVGATRRAGFAAIGPVYNVARDPGGAADEARQLCRLGFRGALCVFPPYVRAIKAAFTPTVRAEIRAIAIREELDHAGQEGYGWTIYDGIKYDLADLPYLDWLVAYAAECRRRDSN